MNILLITSQIPLPLVDGGKKGIFGVLKYLSKAGHNIDLVTFRQHSDIVSTIDILKRYCSPHILDIQTHNNIVGAFINLFSPVPYNMAKYKRNKMKEYLMQLLKKEKYDVAQIHNSHMAWTIDVIKNIQDIPVVLRQENVEMMIMKRFVENESNPFIRNYAKIQLNKFIKYEPKICEKFDKCIMVSKEDERILSEINPNIDISTVPSGVDFEALVSYEIPKIKYSLAHIGNINWIPNRDSLQWFISEIFPEVVSLFPAATLHVYGGGDFKKIKMNNNLAKNILIRGFVENIWKEISDKSLLVVPLRIGSGIRIKILETLALGQPILTTSIGKEGIDVNDGEELLVADSKNDFIDKISKFFNNQYDIRNIAEKGKQFVRQNYDWRAIITEFEKIYKSLKN